MALSKLQSAHDNAEHGADGTDNDSRPHRPAGTPRCCAQRGFTSGIAISVYRHDTRPYSPAFASTGRHQTERGGGAGSAERPAGDTGEMTVERPAASGVSVLSATMAVMMT